MRPITATFLVLGLGLAAVPAGAEPACADHEPLRQPFFGDFHIHTGYSMDAYTMDQRNTPDDAYRFARGDAIRLPPLDSGGAMTREVRLERPLDFAAVTDHAEFLGEVAQCTRPASEMYESVYCRGFRGVGPDGEPVEGIMGRTAAMYGRTTEEHIRSMDAQGHPPSVCGEDGARCRSAARTVWRETQAAAERWNDGTDACRFTSFIAYEYSLTPNLAKVHRNVVFANTSVPALPLSAADEPEPANLWRWLDRECLSAESDCDAVAIPHNSNLSNGRMFHVAYPGTETVEEQAALARLRSKAEPLVEIMQVKGDSECATGMWKVEGGTDELCGFEKFRVGEPEDCEDRFEAGALGGRGCRSRLDFARYALAEGLREQQRIGANPYKFGFIASTDTHNANPGDVEEHSYPGAAGKRDATPAGRLAGVQMELAVSQLRSNPGGLVAVWAEENSRPSLFAGLKRRETYGTSGPRMAVRFFGGWSFPEEACAAPAATGYEQGVAMGSDLPAAPEASNAPSFLVAATRDPGTEAHPGGKLQRIQIVKTWPGEDGVIHERVHDAAGGPNEASVELDTCTPTGAGHDALCAVWTDPEFDASQAAVYYARVLENPSCRYSTWECLALPEGERPPGCSSGEVPQTIQERAWTSPIWYSPPAGG